MGGGARRLGAARGEGPLGEGTYASARPPPPCLPSQLPEFPKQIEETQQHIGEYVDLYQVHLATFESCVLTDERVHGAGLIGSGRKERDKRTIDGDRSIAKSGNWVSHRRCSGRVGSSRDRQFHDGPEVDHDKDPTTLYQLIEEKDCDGATSRLERHPTRLGRGSTGRR